jgi:nucleotide-binding universal stress UspA family protein
MSYATLMVHFDGSPPAHGRLLLTADLALRFQAGLIGITGRLNLPSFLADDVATAADAKDAERQEMTNLLASIEMKFRAGVKQIKNVEWRGKLEYASDLVPQEARAADLIILGRPADSADLYFALDPGVTILRAGRPVLLVPDAVDSLPMRRAVVAWKDCREARRAIQDALPLLRKAKEVMVVEICEPGKEAENQARINDVANYLDRHNVDVQAKAYLHTTQSIASEILRFAKDEKADLIVSGAYGHSRLGEWMFGGVTRDLLAETRLCCLFSH